MSLLTSRSAVFIIAINSDNYFYAWFYSSYLWTFHADSIGRHLLLDSCHVISARPLRGTVYLHKAPNWIADGLSRILLIVIGDHTCSVELAILPSACDSCLENLLQTKAIEHAMKCWAKSQSECHSWITTNSLVRDVTATRVIPETWTSETTAASRQDLHCYRW